MLSGCGSLTREIEQTDPVTAAIEINIKSSLIRSSSVDAAAILVELVDQTVVLSGFVDTQQESAEAERLAIGEANGKQVTNKLEVR